MDFQQILELIRTVSASELTVFRYEEGNQKILMQTGNLALREEDAETCAAAARPADDAPDALQKSDRETAEAEEPSGNLVRSPLVGRFYTAPSEDAEPFVRVGDRVRKGQTLAIVEAMKLMNEIESEYDGIVTEILAENAQSVEYGQPLFRVS